MRFLLVTLCLGLVAATVRAEVSVDVAPAAPTAEMLSEPGALAEYVTESLKARGHCVLPIGVIRTDKTIDLYRV